MSNSASLLLAVGGVFLVTWYGVRQLRRERELRFTAPSFRSPHEERTDHPALLAEFTDRTRDSQEFEFAGGSVLCPNCAMEYPAGTIYCDCGTETAEADEMEEAESPEQWFNHTEDTADSLVCIHVAESHWKAALLKSYLENHGIPCVTRGNVTSGLSHLNVTGGMDVRLMVPAEEATRGRALLRDCL